MKERWIIIGIVALFVIWNVGKILLLIYGDDNVDTYWSDGDKYHVGKCIFIDEYNVDGDYPSKQAAEADGLEPCWLCIHND